jgi:hypothetical protein
VRYEGDLLVTPVNARKFAEIVRVTGCLYVCQGVAFNESALVKCGRVYLCKGATFSPRKLEYCSDLHIYEDATLNAPILVKCGMVAIQEGGTLNAPLIGVVIAQGDAWALVRMPDGRYRAGCRGPFTREEALEHWGGANAKSRRFTEAIIGCTN